MSLQVNLSSRDLSQAYQDVVNARGIDWAIFAYGKGSNDLKVQETGDGGLDEPREEFSDGRCVSLLNFSSHASDLPSLRLGCSMHSLESRTQTYALLPLPLTRVLTSFESTLPKFVQVGWCGDGVPEARKGLFHTHTLQRRRQLPLWHPRHHQRPQ